MGWRWVPAVPAVPAVEGLQTRSIPCALPRIPADDQSSGWACQRCCAAAPGALCFHKAPAAAAGLCFFDCRATQAMVARFSTAHRSLYPHIEAVRQHFLLTSHAGTPVAVWDCR